MLASLSLHAGVVALLLFSLSLDPTPLKTPDTDVIKAVVVDDGKVKAEIERIKKLERRKHKQQEKAKKELKRIKKQKELEKKQLAEIKRERVQEKQRLKAEQKAAKIKRKEIKQAQVKEKKRLEKQRAKRKMEQEKKRKAEVAAQRKAEAEAKRKAQKAKEEKATREALRKQKEAEESAERQRDLARKSTTYIAAIRNRVQRNWRRPPGVNKGAACKVFVTQAPGGFVLSVRVSSCSGGSAAFSKSVEKAVHKADPLPKAPDPSLFDRQIVFDFIVKE